MLGIHARLCLKELSGNVVAVMMGVRRRRIGLGAPPRRMHRVRRLCEGHAKSVRILRIAQGALTLEAGVMAELGLKLSGT